MFDAVSRRLAKEGWHHSELRRFNSKLDFPSCIASWCSRTNDRGECVGSWDGKGLIHAFSLGCTVKREQPTLVHEMGIEARWIPDTGTGASLGYGSGEQGCWFYVYFYPNVKKVNDWERQPPLSFPFGYYHQIKRFGNVSYMIQVQAKEFRPDGKDRTWTDAQIMQHLGSAESLRDAMIREADSLEHRMRELIPSQEAVFEYWDDTGASSAHPPMRWSGPPTDEYALSLGQTTEMLDDALAELNRRRDLIRTHYQAMHAAMEAAFPLVECLRSIKSKEFHGHQDDSAEQPGKGSGEDPS
jgi:hypothetical protein